MESSTRTALDLDLLLAQTDWVQGLARRLVVDEERARDVAQDTFLAALERPPERAANERSLRAWLARVVRSIVHGGSRSEVRRKFRESLAARPPQSDSAADTVARAAQLQLVVDTVMEVEEPYRAALLMTYFDGLSAAEVGLRIGATEVAVRKRVSRGLQRLRDKLDRLHDGDRNAWVSAFLPWLAWHPPVALPSGAGGLAVGTKVAAALLAAGVGVFVLDSATTGEDVPVVTVAPSLLASAAPGVERLALGPSVERRAGVDVPLTQGWLNVIADRQQPIAWRIEADGQLLRGAWADAGRATFPVPVDRALDLVAVTSGERTVIALEPFAAGEVRDLVVSLTRVQPATEVARNVPSEGASPERGPSMVSAGASHVVRLARHLGAVERGPEHAAPRYVAAARVTASARGTLAPTSTESFTGVWASLQSGAVLQAAGGAESSPNAPSKTHGKGTGFAATALSSGPTGSRWAGGGASLSKGSSVASSALFAIAGSSDEREPRRLLVIDGATGWPAWAATTALAPQAGGGLSVLAVTADGRMGAATVRADGSLPVVPVHEPATLALSSDLQAACVTIHVDGVEWVHASPSELGGSVQLPTGQASVRFADASGRTLAEHGVGLRPGVNSIH